MPKTLAPLAALSILFGGGALAQTCTTYPNTLTNGTSADANQVMANFNCAALLGGASYTGQITVAPAVPFPAITVNSSGTAGIALQHTGGPNASIWNDGNLHVEGQGNLWLNQIGSGNVFIAAGGGSVGIDTSSPSYTFFVNGSSGGTQAWTVASDARLKTDIRPIPNALDLVTRLRGVSFEWRAADAREVGKTLKLPVGERQFGFIAQEVEAVAPEAVTQPQGPDGTYGMKDGSLTAILLEAVKAQQAEIAELRGEVAALKGK